MDSKTLESYKSTLKNAGPRLKEHILHRLEQEADLTLDEFLELCRAAYPDVYEAEDE